jgi:hypothetical protein
MPPGFPKGDTAYTTAKVIVARSFPSPDTSWKYAKLPFDPQESDHATHVAGIAAGDYSPNAIAGRGPLSGVAPRAYLGNYKVLTYPTENFGLNGNAPEIAAGVEAAVRDGMNVINLSLGEAEIEPARDLVSPRSTPQPTPAPWRRPPPATTSRTTVAAASPRPAAP